MRTARRVNIGVVAILAALSLTTCSPETASAPDTSTTRRAAAPITVAVPVTPTVPSAVPTGLSIPSLGLTTAVRELPPSKCPVLNPPTYGEAYWVGCRSKPGTDSDGTTFIIGHAVRGGHGVFGRLQDLAAGADVVVTTSKGSLTYRVEHTVEYAKYGEIQDSPEVMNRVPGRLILVTCLLGKDGSSTDKNFVAQAQLVESALPR